MKWEGTTVARMAGKYYLGKHNVDRSSDAAFEKVSNFETKEKRSAQRKSWQIGLSRARCYFLRWSRRTRGARTIRTKQILVNMQMTADNPDLWRPRWITRRIKFVFSSAMLVSWLDSGSRFVRSSARLRSAVFSFSRSNPCLAITKKENARTTMLRQRRRKPAGTEERTKKGEV